MYNVCAWQILNITVNCDLNYDLKRGLNELITPFSCHSLSDSSRRVYYRGETFDEDCM